jgi:hypothetical protein
VRKPDEQQTEKIIKATLQKARHTASWIDKFSVREVQNNLDAKTNARRSAAEGILALPKKL